MSVRRIMFGKDHTSLEEGRPASIQKERQDI